MAALILNPYTVKANLFQSDHCKQKHVSYPKAIKYSLIFKFIRLCVYVTKYKCLSLYKVQNNPHHFQ